MRRSGGFPPPQMTGAQSLEQLIIDLASLPDERLLSATVDTLMPRYKVQRQLLECKLLASQETRRRHNAEREAICRAFAEGRQAAQRDQPRAANPYRPSEAVYDAWSEGYDEQEGPAFKVVG